MESLTKVLYDILCLHPDGLQEYALVQMLKRQGIVPFAESNLSDELSLFRVHFFLFHQLYRLQEQLRQEKRGDLNIHCLSIQVLPWRETIWQGLELPDPLRSYYLDQTRLATTTKEEVVVMLEWFWKRFNNQDGVKEALATLGLPDEATVTHIKQRYRELAKMHHPDAGGSAARFRAIAEAADLLLNAYC